MGPPWADFAACGCAESVVRTGLAGDSYDVYVDVGVGVPVWECVAGGEVDGFLVSVDVAVGES
jgi:hypothetical protein